MVLFAYISYDLGELLSLSGIISLLFCGIMMQHYHWFALFKPFFFCFDSKTLSGIRFLWKRKSQALEYSS
jgi:hypothetical protein